MSLIKQASRPATLQRWRPGEAAVAADAPVQAEPFAEERVALLAQLAGLAAERDGLAARLTAMEVETAEAVVAARAEGRAAGLAEAVERADQAVERLEQGLAAAVAQLGADEASLQRLSIAIARTALERILHQPTEAAALVEAAIRRQLDALESELVVRVEVSAADFTDPERLARLAQAVGRGRIQVLASRALASGECRVRLKLGEIDIGLPQQWRRLSAVLDRHAGSLADGR